MKIGYFADGPWSHLAFKKLINDKSIEIAFIVPRTDTKDGTLKEYCEKYNIDYLNNIKVNSDFFYEKAFSYNCDLFVSMSFNQIFRNRIINLPKLGTINCHAGKLPFYRGRNILNWALINDEKEFGITVHYIDKGIDTGDIILQNTYPINDSDSYKSLLNVAFNECAITLYDAIKMIQKDKVNRIPQDSIHKVGMYCGTRTFGDEIINWNLTSREIFNFIRAIDSPGPIARTYLNGNEIKINKAELIEEAVKYVNTVGQIVGVENGKFIVKSSDTTILISEITVKEGVKLKVGDRFTNGK